jgi:alkylation response protein AidB-like acyl-CoA dehydrogenase
VWTDEELAFRDSARRFVDAEIAPLRHALEHEGREPYGVLQRWNEALGLRATALDRFEAAMAGEEVPRPSAAERIIPMVEVSRHSPGLVTAMGVSTGLTAGAILRAGNDEQRRRWVPDLLTLRRVGAWAITEPDSGSDAFGGMRTTAHPVANGFVLNGSKTFITNGPSADTLDVIARRAGGTPRDVVTLVLDRGMDGLEQGPPMGKMGLRSSPTGEIAFHDVFVSDDRVLRGRSPERSASSRGGARETFAVERASVTAMALGVIDRCLELSTAYARDLVQFGRPIGDFQLIQLKLADMEIARLNVENLVVRYVRSVDSGARPGLAEASAMKLYAARSAVAVALEAVQVHGGAGYMADSHVEQLCRDAKVLQIYGGTDEIQVTHIARDLLARHG